MNRITFRFILGLVIACIGASILADLVFDVHLPLVRAAIAVLLLALGARMITHAWVPRGRRGGDAWLSDRRFTPTGALDHDTRFDVVFGRGVVDLTGLADPRDDVTVTVDALFGSAVVKVDPAIAYDVEGRSAFGEVRMPDRTMAAMGALTYRRPGPERPHLHLRVNAVFGACQVIEGAPPA